MFVFDAHTDTAHALSENPAGFGNPRMHYTPEKARLGGLSAQIFALWVDPLFAPHRALHQAMILFHTLETRVFSPGLSVMVRTVDAMDETVRSGGHAGWVFLEGGHTIENSLEILEIFHFLGVRGMTLTHWKNTEWADSSGDEPRWKGLSDLGRRIVSRMNGLGMAVDVSHTSDDTVRSVLECSCKPVMASHSNVRVLCPIPRNLPDDLIRTILEQGGFIGVNFFPAFLEYRVQAQLNANLDKLQKTRPQDQTSDPDQRSRADNAMFAKAVLGNDPVGLDRVIDHIAHIAGIGGIDGVGLGSDFDGIPSTPKDLPDVSAFPVLAQELARRGFSEAEIRKVMGENLRRFLKAVETSDAA